jgi:hypothetical protein
MNLWHYFMLIRVKNCKKSRGDHAVNGWWLYIYFLPFGPIFSFGLILPFSVPF